MIDAKNLTKSFKIKNSKDTPKYTFITAVDHLDFNISKGEIFGIVGPNGAGKTTTAKILSTIILPDEGTATIDGYDVVQDADIVKDKIGLLAGEYARSLYWRISGIRNLEFFARLRGMRNAKDRIKELLEMFDLTDKQNELVMKYSTGMKHKLAFAVSLLHDPQVLFLDEPLTGIDPVTTHELKKLIKKEFSDKTIIWTSHNLYEIEEMCDRIALIDKGKIVLQGSPEALGRSFWDHIKILVTSDNPGKFSYFDAVNLNNNTVEIKTRDVNKTISEISDFSRLNNIRIFDIKTIKPSLEEIFLEVMKKNV
jgi:ABC-2 type transport system ATP-binding protein